MECVSMKMKIIYDLETYVVQSHSSFAYKRNSKINFPLKWITKEIFNALLNRWKNKNECQLSLKKVI